jgi:hypothetical protein
MSATVKLLAVKAILASMGVAGGGLGLAAATGHLPAHPGGTPAAAGSASAEASASASPGPSATSHPAASPSPSLRGLCQAYTSQVGRNPGKAPGNPAFTVLITAAGAKDKVASYCTSLLAVTPANSPTAHPTGKPSSHPTGKPTAHPAGKPTSHP